MVILALGHTIIIIIISIIIVNAYRVLSMCQVPFQVFYIYRFIYSFSQSHEVGTIMSPILQMRKLSHRKFKQIVQCTSQLGRGKNQNINSGSVRLSRVKGTFVTYSCFVSLQSAEPTPMYVNYLKAGISSIKEVTTLND